MFPQIVPWLLLLSVLIRGAGPATISPDAVPPAPGILDPVFAYLVGLVDADLYGTIDAVNLDTAVGRSGATSGLPYRTLRSLIRTKGEGRFDTTVVAEFDAPLDLAIPYSILGYNPGSLRGSRRVTFRELPLGDFLFKQGDDRGTTVVRFSAVRIFGVREGALRIDIDRWIDLLAGGKLDDTRVTGLALFEYEGERWGMALGYNRSWKGRSGVLSFRENKIRFPSPPAMKTAAWKLRQVLESYEPSLRPDSLRVNGGW